jgi:hypothetical protein
VEGSVNFYSSPFDQIGVAPAVVAVTVGVEHGYRSQALGFQSPQDSPPGAVAKARVNKDGLPLFTYHHADVDDPV